MSYLTRLSQAATVDANNSSTANLASAASFVGTAVSTLGVSALQVSLKTDQNASIMVEQTSGLGTGAGTVTTNGSTTLTGSGTNFLSLRVGDQIYVNTETVRVIATISSDTVLTVTSAFSTSTAGLSWQHYNWDVNDQYSYYTTVNNFGVTVQAVNSYYRVRVTNTGGSTSTYFRLNSVLCPIVEAMPRSLDANQNLKVAVKTLDSIDFGRPVMVDLTRNLRTSQTVKLVGTTFNGTTVDTNFWTTTVANGGTVTQLDGYMFLQTNTTANGSAKVTSVRKARYLPASSNWCRMQVQIPAITGNCIVRGGAYDASDGYFFEIENTTLKVGYRNNGSDTTVSNGSFNGSYGATVSLTASMRTIEIFWTNKSLVFQMDGITVHTFTATTAPLSRTTTLPITGEIVNSGGNTNNNTAKVAVMSINRVGQLRSERAYKNIAASTTTVLKYSAGRLYRVLINEPNASNITVTIYDNTSATGTIIATIVYAKAAGGFNTWEFDCPFHTGLTVVTNNAANITVIFE